jgi:hypothetical protein
MRNKITAKSRTRALENPNRLWFRKTDDDDRARLEDFIKIGKQLDVIMEKC